MPPVVSADQARAVRLRAQWLAERATPEVASTGAERVTRIVRHLGAVQAQYASAAQLAVRARGEPLLAADVERARVHDRTLVRTWLLRGTLHLVAADDLDWLLALFGPLNIVGDQLRRLQLGLDDTIAARGIQLLRAALAEYGPLTRAEIVAQLSKQGLQLAGQARPHLIALGAHQGILCHGPERADGEPTYALLDDWLPEQPSRLWHRSPMPPDHALADMARRYIRAYGPAEPDDLAAWSGLPIGQARAAWQHIASELTAVELEGRTLWLHADHAARLYASPDDATPIVRLVPGYDPYLLGYRSRDLAIAPAYARHVHPGGGVLHPALLVDGRVLGTWRSASRRNRLTIAVTPFAPLARFIAPLLEIEAAAIGRFLAQPATLRIEAPAG